jgi:type IV pilus assembly protein PilW
VNPTDPRRPFRRIDRPRGIGLVELLVGMTLGLVLIGGALVAHQRARDTYRALEVTARLQDIGRYALAQVESDVRMAGYLGLVSRPELLTNLDGPLADAAGAPAELRGCTEDWATGLGRPVSGWDHTDGAWPLVDPCRPSGRWRSTTDGLIVKRASADRIAQTKAGLKAYHRHALVASSHGAALVFVGHADGIIPVDYAQADPPEGPPLADTRRLLVNAYYVSTDSSEGAGYPSLRRKRLVAGPAVQDEEVIPGIEDLQARYGVDVDGDDSADRYLDASDLDAGMTVVSVRVWLRVRAAEREPAQHDTPRYAYANLDERLPAAERPFRRLVLSRTIHLRNSRGS